MVTNAAITIFNGRVDKEARRKAYTHTVIRGVSYVEAKGANVTNNGVWSDNVQYKIRVPLTADFQDGRTYLPAVEYAKLDDGEALKHWTISREDLIVKGEYAGECAPVYEDALKGLELIRVTEYADSTEGGSLYTRHWRIGGK